MPETSSSAQVEFENLDFVYLELTVKCNLACHFCDNSVRNLYKDLPTEQFRAIVDQLKPGTRLCLHGLGEPTLHRDLLELIAYAKARDLYVYFNTNHTVTTERQMEGFVEHELDELRISISAGSREKFAEYTGSDLFDALLDRSRRMVEIRGARPKPKLRFVFVLTKQSVSEYRAVVRIAEELGVDELMVQSYLNWGKPKSADEPEEGCAVEDRELEEMRRKVLDATDSARRVRVFLPSRLNGQNPEGEEDSPGSCQWPFNAAWITANGHVTPCCNLHDPRQLSLGNAFVRPLQSIWLGEDYQNFRARYQAGKVEACQSCPVHYGRFKTYSYQRETAGY